MSLRAFVVEDNETLREHLAGALEELTCVRVVGGAGTEEEAIEGLARGEWDIAIVDLFLKHGNGLQLVQHMARHPGQKVVVFSNYVNAHLRKRCAQLGIDAVFDKSTEIDQLVDYCSLQCAEAEAAERVQER